MDISTVIGLVLAIGLVLGSIIMGGGLGPFIDFPSLMITVGGSIAAVLINFQLKVALGTFGVVKKCFMVRIATPQEVIVQFRDFATTARRDGLLALEDAVDNVDDEFLNSVEEIGRSSAGPKWFQVYVPRKRDVAAKLVARAEAAGFKAIVVTVDLGERKDADLRNRFTVPKDMLLKHLRDVGFSHLTDRNSHEELNAFNAAAWDISLNVDFFKWLRGKTKLPILLKGVLSPDAAQQAVDLGLNGIIVSNHGGRRLDGMPASIDVLHEVAQAVDGKIEILMDGGVRRGGDVMKAVAFGAKAVLIGRPQAWALAAEGEAGVKRVLDILRDELTNAMIASGCATVDDVNASLLRV